MGLGGVKEVTLIATHRPVSAGKHSNCAASHQPVSQGHESLENSTTGTQNKNLDSQISQFFCFVLLLFLAICKMLTVQSV